MWRWFVIPVCALALAAPVPAAPLTLAEAQSLALGEQPALQAFELSARAAEAAAVADGSLPDPRLKLGALNFPVRDFPRSRDGMTQWSVSWEQMFPGGDKRRLRTERSRAEAELHRAESRSRHRAIVRDVGFAWVDAWLAAASLRQIDVLAREHAQAIELARIALGAGRGSQAEVFAARQALAQIEDRRIELAAQVDRARAALARWIPQAGGRTPADELPALVAPAPIARLRDRLPAHPQLAWRARGEALADAETALARESRRPDRSVEVGYMVREGENRSDMVMVQVAFELPFWAERKQDRQIESALAQRERARELRDDALRALTFELETAHADWRAAGERLANLRGAIVPDARGRLETLIAQHASGAAPLAAVFEARRALVELNVQELAVRAAQLRARIALQYFEAEETGS